MSARILPVVLALVLCGSSLSSVQAGLLLRGVSETNVVVLSHQRTSAMINWLASQQEQDKVVSCLHDVECGLAAIGHPSTGAGVIGCTLNARVSMTVIPGLSWRISIGNSFLLDPPLLDGLLKPS